MRITTRGRYALRAILALARLGKNEELVSIANLAETESISSVFLEQIFFKLKKAGIVQSMRGPGGGFSFARPLHSITVKEVLDAAGEDLSVSPCDKHSDGCIRINDCSSHKVWVTIAELINDYLSNLTLAALLEQENARGRKDESAYETR
jgi:Rrf2 family iron-sulfur cluster assembly transcriptional regulator